MGLSRNAGWHVKLLFLFSWLGWCLVTWNDLFSSVVSIFSYSIKLLAVQELLDREALEKVNTLFFLPHIHKLRAECHMQEKFSSLSPGTTLSAEWVCCFVFLSQWTMGNCHQNSPRCSYPVTNSALLSSFRAVWQQRLAMLWGSLSVPLSTMHWTRLYAGCRTPFLHVTVTVGAYGP